jgi:hypothetical protein
MLNRLETNYYKSAITSTQYINGSGDYGTPKDADYLVLYRHNLATAASIVTIQTSIDGNFVANAVDVASGEPTSDDLFYLPFTKTTSSYWRVQIAKASIAPQITIGYWGVAAELDWCSVSFDPNSQRIRDDVNRSETGYQLGVYERYTERTQRFTWNDAETDVYDELETWHNTIGRQNFFTAWDTTDHADEIYLMYSDGVFNNPYTLNGRYRNCSVNLTGRKI